MLQAMTHLRIFCVWLCLGYFRYGALVVALGTAFESSLAPPEAHLQHCSSLLQRGAEFQETAMTVKESGVPPSSDQGVGFIASGSSEEKDLLSSNAGRQLQSSRMKVAARAFQLRVPGLCLLVLLITTIICCIGRRCGQVAKGKEPEAQEGETTEEAAEKNIPSKGKFRVNEDATITFDPEGKVYTYNADTLLEWKSVFKTSGSVFLDHRVLGTVGRVIVLTAVVAMAQVFCVPHTHGFNTERFQDFFKFVRVFIAFLLGLYLNSSFARWWHTVSSFKKFLVSIRQLMYTLHTIGVRSDAKRKVERLCIGACYILNEDMHAAAVLQTREGSETRWRKKICWMTENGFLNHSEREELEAKGSSLGQLGLHSQVIWSWIGEVITEVKQEPQLTPPMYVKLIVLCHTCMSCQEDLQTNLMVQVPFSYAHLLAVLVHVVNIFFALASGLTIGVEIVAAREKGAWYEFEDIEATILLFFTLCAQPMLYQAVLVIADANVQPYGSEMKHLPTDTFIRQMRDELEIMHDGFDNARRRAREASGAKIVEHAAGASAGIALMAAGSGAAIAAGASLLATSATTEHNKKDCHDDPNHEMQQQEQEEEEDEDQDCEDV